MNFKTEVAISFLFCIHTYITYTWHHESHEVHVLNNLRNYPFFTHLNIPPKVGHLPCSKAKTSSISLGFCDFHFYIVIIAEISVISFSLRALFVQKWRSLLRSLDLRRHLFSKITLSVPPTDPRCVLLFVFSFRWFVYELSSDELICICRNFSYYFNFRYVNVYL